MRILVTGANGHVASRLLPRIAADHDVIALVRPGTRPTAGDVEAFEVDLAALDARALPAQLDAIVHLAQSRFFREFPERAADVFAVNVESTARLLEHAHAAGASTFVFASSGSVYADHPEAVDEDAPLAPRSHYGATKAAADLIVRSYATVLNTVVLRPFAIYGAGQQGMLVPNLLARLRLGEVVEIEGEPGIRLSPVHVEDAARAFEAALSLQRSAVVNVAGNEVVSLRRLVEVLAEADGREARIRHVGEGDGGASIGDNTRMRNELGVEPGTPLAEGLAEVVASVSAPGR
jgi:UDP-glucose 4-epimerase